MEFPTITCKNFNVSWMPVEHDWSSAHLNTVILRRLLEQLHWLPIRLRIEFKILLITFKVLQGSAPKYLIDLICVLPHPIMIYPMGDGGAKVQVTGHRSGHRPRPQVRSQVTGYRSGYRPQVTGHRSGQRSQKTIGHWKKLFWTDVLLYKNKISQGTLMVFLSFKQY